MPNDEYFEAKERERAANWTQTFLRYPPVFLGVNGMRMIQQRLQEGIPMKHEAWVAEARALEAFGFSPAEYELVRRRLELLDSRSRLSAHTIARLFEPASRRADGGLPWRLDLLEWGGYARARESGLALHSVVDTLCFASARVLAERAKRVLDRNHRVAVAYHRAYREKMIRAGKIKRVTKKQLERERQERLEESFWMSMTSQMQENYRRARTTGQKPQQAAR